MYRRIEGKWTRWPVLLSLASLIAGYFLITWAISSRRLLWHDELITYYLATRPDFRDVWTALLTGAEQTPPLFYVLTRTAIAMLGVNPLSLRLFEMLGVGTAALSIYVFAARRVPRLCAAAGAILFLSTSAYYYAYE